MPMTATCLWFDTQGLDAAEYYVSVFPNSTIDDISYWGAENPERQGQVLEVAFTLDGHHFVALNGGPEFTFTEAFSISIDCADQSEVDHYWDRLTDGGQEVQCGWLKDRFGLSWQVTPVRLRELMKDPDRARAQRAVEAMLTMVKLDVAALEKAADGS